MHQFVVSFESRNLILNINVRDLKLMRNWFKLCCWNVERKL